MFFWKCFLRRDLQKEFKNGYNPRGCVFFEGIPGISAPLRAHSGALMWSRQYRMSRQIGIKSYLDREEVAENGEQKKTLVPRPQPATFEAGTLILKCAIPTRAGLRMPLPRQKAEKAPFVQALPSNLHSPDWQKRGLADLPLVAVWRRRSYPHNAAPPKVDFGCEGGSSTPIST